MVGGDADALSGGNANDILVGGSSLDGGAGTDLITSTGGSTITAGPGTDFVNAADGSGAADTISCGPGYDVVWADAIDRVARDCERRLSGPAPALPGTAAAIADAQALLAHRPSVDSSHSAAHAATDDPAGGRFSRRRGSARASGVAGAPRPADPRPAATQADARDR